MRFALICSYDRTEVSDPIVEPEDNDSYGDAPRGITMLSFEPAVSESTDQGDREAGR